MKICDIKAVYIDPRCMFNYTSYYLLGLKTIFSGKVYFKSGLFQDLPMDNYEDYRKGVAIIFKTEKSIRKIFLDFYDSNEYSQKFYKWADLYCAVNTREDTTKLSKLFVIGPSFSISMYNVFSLSLLMLRNYIKSFSLNYRPPIKIFIRDYFYTLYRRLQISCYDQNISVDPQYCFSVSTLWYDNLTDKTTNYYRGIFTKIASKEFPLFEGGFYFIESKNVLKEFPKYAEYEKSYKTLLLTKRYSMKEYILKIKRSLLVFNTPSVKGCLGWKLPEYLKMGKVIISTKIENKMPGDFLPGIHYILVSNESEIKRAIQNVKVDSSLQKRLSFKAKEYYDLYLSPEKVIERIISQLN